MKIAYLINTYPKPTHSFIRREIAALRELGVQVPVFSIRRFNGTLVSESDVRESTLTHVILDAGHGSILLSILRQIVGSPIKSWRGLQTAWRLHRKSDSGFVRHLAYFSEACVLRRWLIECGAEHLHVHFGTNSAAAAMICRALGGPTWSLTIHGPDEFFEGNQIALREKIAAASFVVGISDFGIQQLRTWTDESAWSKLKLVRCGLEDELLRRPVTPVPETNRIVCVGRLCEQKLQRVLIDAVAKLIARNISVHLTLVGDGEARSALEAQVNRLAIRDHVTFAGWCSEEQVRQQIEASRVLVLPSKDEGLPVAIMEAFALGRPMISTNVGAIPELVEPRNSGWLISPFDVDALGDAIEQALHTDGARLSEMAQIGRERVLRNHSAIENARVLSELFRSASTP